MALRGRSKRTGSREPLRSSQAAERQTRERPDPERGVARNSTKAERTGPRMEAREPPGDRSTGTYKSKDLQGVCPTVPREQRDPQVQTSASKPEFTTDEDLTLVVYRDPGACSTITSRHLEVVVLSNMPVRQVRTVGRVPLIVQEEVGLSRTTVEGSRGPSLPEACTTKAPGVQHPDAFVPTLVTMGEISFGDRTRYQQERRRHQEDGYNRYRVGPYHGYEDAGGRTPAGWTS